MSNIFLHFLEYLLRYMHTSSYILWFVGKCSLHLCIKITWTRHEGLKYFLLKIHFKFKLEFFFKVTFRQILMTLAMFDSLFIICMSVSFSLPKLMPIYRLGLCSCYFNKAFSVGSILSTCRCGEIWFSWSSVSMLHLLLLPVLVASRQMMEHWNTN